MAHAGDLRIVSSRDSVIFIAGRFGRVGLQQSVQSGIIEGRDAPVAQWIEQRFPKPRVSRSSRLGGATV